MKVNKGWTLVLCFLALCLVAMPVMAQQLTGDLIIKAVDPSKALVSGAKVTVTSQSLIRPLEGVTDSEGLFFARSLPSGLYKIVIEKSGFKQAVHESVRVEVGKTYTVEMPMAMGMTSETIEVSANAVQIDTVKSESAQVYQGESLTTLPGGRNFEDFAKLAPSVNNESTAGGLSVDGASGSENQFYVDGVTTSNIKTGLANVGIRTEIVQEMQVKTGGYDAEFGGAMGGVVSVVTKSGSNDFHGQGYYYYGGSGLEGCFLNFSGDANGTGYNCHRVYVDPVDSTQVVDKTFKSDHYTNNELGVNLGGPIWKDKAWFFVNVNPNFNNITRNTMLDDGVWQDFRQKQTRRAGMAKIDIQPFQSLRLFLNYSQDTFRYKGALPNYVTYVDPTSQKEVGVSSTTYDWRNEGYKYPAYAFGGGATWTVTPKILVDSRYGFNGNDLIQFLQPTIPTRLLRVNPSSVVGWTSAMGEGFKPGGYFNQNPGDVYATTQDYEKKLSWTTTGSATFNFGGVHNFKSGYIWERWAYDTASAHIYDYLRFNFGLSYTDLNGNVRSSSCQGPDGNTYTPCGYLEVRSPFGTIAKLHTDHKAFFFQDAWTIGRRLTINPGIRFEAEEIPSFSTIPQYAHAAVKWSFGDKIAPRFGASFDLFGNGKAKIYGSWGRFYDQMKLTMAEGSFGGFKWHSQYYLLNSNAVANWYNMGQPHGATDFSPNCTGSLTGGTTTCDPYPTGVADDPGLQFIDDRDWRLPSFDTLDPEIQPMRMQNATVGTEWQLPGNYIFSFQYVHKQLDRTIEDVGVLTPLGEKYYITNPGYGYSVDKFTEIGLPATPKAKRNYNAGEFRIRKPFSKSWMADFSYTYSKLYGNYGGLASSDEDTSNGTGQGRTDPNVERYFDEWYLNYQANNGELAYGPLNTDRPHQIKFNGTYQLPKNLPQLSVFYTAQSGAPITTIATVENSEMIMNGRGDLGRLPWFTQTDFSVKQVFKPFKSESKSIEFSVNVLNLFNQQGVLHRYRNITQSSLQYGFISYPDNQGAGADWASGDDLASVNQFLGHGWNGTGDWQTSLQAYEAYNEGGIVDPRYNKNDLWQLPTRVRLGLRFSF